MLCILQIQQILGVHKPYPFLWMAPTYVLLCKMVKKKKKNLWVKIEWKELFQNLTEVQDIVVAVISQQLHWRIPSFLWYSLY